MDVYDENMMQSMKAERSFLFQLPPSAAQYLARANFGHFRLDQNNMVQSYSSWENTLWITSV